MGFPLAGGGRLVNRRWGPREWNGRQLNHNGIDQAFGDGTQVRPEHPGRLAGPALHLLDSGVIGSLGGVGLNGVYGHWAMYQVTDDLRVSYHQLRPGGRGADEITPGETVIGLVGSPLLTVKPVTARQAKSNWSGATVGLSDRSGPHLHTQCWRLVRGVYIPVDPDSSWVADQIEKALEDQMPSAEEIARATVDLAKKELPGSVWGHRVGVSGDQVSPNGKAGDLLSKTFARAGSAANTARGLVAIVKGLEFDTAPPADVAKELAGLIGPRADAKAIVAELGKQLSS